MPMKTQGSINGVKAITTTEKKRRRDEDVIEMKEVVARKEMEDE